MVNYHLFFSVTIAHNKMYITSIKIFVVFETYLNVNM